MIRIEFSKSGKLCRHFKTVLAVRALLSPQFTKPVKKSVQAMLNCFSLKTNVKQSSIQHNSQLKNKAQSIWPLITSA